MANDVSGLLGFRTSVVRPVVVALRGVKAGNPYRRGRLITIDLPSLTSLDQLIFIFKILFTLVTKQDT